jgi:hypothetical protein
MERSKKCTASGCGCIGYVSDLTNRRFCTCGHAAANHKPDEWELSALPAVEGPIWSGGLDTRAIVDRGQGVESGCEKFCEIG